MKVYVFQSTGPVELALDQLDEPSSGPRIGWNDAYPTSGYWKVGDRIYNSVGGGGWVCEAEGDPGTWVADGGGTTPAAEVAGFAMVDGAGAQVNVGGVVSSIVLNGNGSYIMNFSPAYAGVNNYTVLGTGDGNSDVVSSLAGKETTRCFPTTLLGGTPLTVPATFIVYTLNLPN